MHLSILTKHILAATFLSVLVSMPARAEAVAVAASSDSDAVGFGTGAKKNKALNAAKADCKKANSGKSCKTWYWTKNTSHLTMIRCNFSLGTKENGEFFVFGVHSNESLTASKNNAFKNLNEKLNYSGLKAKSDNCKIIASYTNGAFSKN